MDYLDWNSRLFEGLVARVGRPGDPLFLYVDAELLAQCRGAGTPAEALADFKQAWIGDFEKPYRQALRWKNAGYPGRPPFVFALVMTVLAATLDPIGKSAANVYRRQRDLLGLSTEGGVPPGYEEFVPSIWRIWNDWLSAVGAEFGGPTAKVVGNYTIQGYARSQAFIRARDREDIYELFADKAAGVSNSDSGGELASKLEVWLRGKSHPDARLLRVSSDSALRDELAQCLSSMLRYWSGEQITRTKPANLRASFHWDDESDSPSLVVKIADVRGSVGTRIVDLSLQEYEIPPGEAFVFLTEASADPALWMAERIVDWPLAEMWTVSWEPRETYLLEAAFDGQWVEADRVVEHRQYRVLCHTADAVVYSGWTAVPTILPGYSWLARGAQRNLSSEDAQHFGELSKKPTSRKAIVGIEGGLPLATKSYLVGGEPDLRITEFGGLTSIVVDEREMLPELLPGRGDYAGLLLSLRSLNLGQGDHHVVTTVAGKSASFDFQSSNPSFGLSDLYGTSDEISVSTSSFMPVRPGMAMVAIDRSGNCWALHPEPDIRRWLSGLGLDRFDRVERIVDLSVPELLDSDVLLIATRRSRNRPWYVCRRGADIQRLARFRVSASVATLDHPDVLAMISSPRAYEDEQTKRDFALAINSMRGRQQARSEAYTLRGDVAMPKVPLREDIQIETHAENPFDCYLFWLTELGAEGATILRSERAWRWLQHALGSSPIQYETGIRTLRALGHIENGERGRIRVTTPRARLMPDSEGLSIITGARSGDLLSSLRTGGDRTAAPIQQRALQDLVAYEFVQVEGKNPMGPTTTYVRFDQADPERQAGHLGISLDIGESHKLLDHAPALKDRIEGAEQYRQPQGVRWDEFVWSDVSPGGKWRRRAGLPSAGEAFLRATSSHSASYLWWNSQTAELQVVGWVSGLWAYQSRIAGRTLLQHNPAEDQLAVREEFAPLPTDIRLALTLRTGLIPQEEGYTERGGRWKVFENVSTRAAKKVAELLEQKIVLR